MIRLENTGIQRKENLKSRDVKHLRIEDVRTLYEIYDFQERIGHGSYGTVISAYEKSTNINYAIKIVNKFSASSYQISLAYREINILKTVVHPNIVCLYRVYESNKKIYMIFERCKHNLRTAFDSKLILFTEQNSRKLIKQLVSAVYYLHKHDIVHRDIKMENILLTANPNDPSDEMFIKLTDFGLSTRKTGIGIGSMLKERCGTMLYIAPEILLNHAYSELCDVWSIGIILYTLLHENFPFFSLKESELMKLIVHTQPEYDDDISPDAIDLIKLCLKKEPVNRITALEILKHPWLVDNKKISRKDENVFDYMKKWKHEMMLPGVDSDWISASERLDEGRNSLGTSTSNTVPVVRSKKRPKYSPGRVSAIIYGSNLTNSSVSYQQRTSQSSK